MPGDSASMHSGDWDDLRFVYAVARAGSLAGAARLLKVNHTTVLRRLGAYETRLGVRLFERLPTGYLPTPTGAEMIAQIAGIDAAIHDVERRALGRDRRLSGTVRLATTDTLMASLLPAALGALRREHPDIVLEVSTANAYAVLTRREADIALRPTATPPETLIGRRIASLGYAPYASLGYLAERQDLSLERHAWLAPDDTLRETVAARWMRATLKDATPAMSADSLVGLRDLAAAGLGVAMLPCYLGDATPALTRLPGLRPIDLGSALWILVHEDLRRVPRIAAVVTSLAASFQAIRAQLEG